MRKLFKIKDKDGTIIPKKIFWLAFIGVLVVCVLYVVIMLFVPVKSPVNLESRGAFGDMFGAIGALFSGLAFAGLIVTMLQQRDDLKNQKDEIELQRKEIELQRKDLEAQTEALRLQKEEIAQTNKELQLQRSEMETQNKTIMLQRFENTFFNMLDMQRGIVRDLKFTYKRTGEKFEGNEVINVNSIKYDEDEDNKTIEKYEEAFYERIKDGVLDHYFRNIYKILQFVDEYDSNIISSDEKYKYLSLLQAQFSSQELLILFYLCLNEYWSDDLKPLVEKYAMLSNLRPALLIEERHKEEFNKSAFKYHYCGHS